MSNNANLRRADRVENDEFYTRLEDINNEVQHYREFFNNKIVYCNCDDGNWSNFWRFFYANFEFFGMKKLIATSYHENEAAFKYEYEGGYDRTDYVSNEYLEGVVKTQLTGNGDFRSEECVNIMLSSDVIVTNPPFSLIKEFIPMLVSNNKSFLIIGPMNAMTYNNIFPLIKKDKLWLGYSMVKEFNQPDGTTKKFGNIYWFTNIVTNKRLHEEEYYAEYNENDYPKYDNYDAIEVSRVANIPCDYTEVMGVPITFIDKYCPTQFEIIGGFNGYKSCDYDNGLVCGTMTEFYDNKGNRKEWTGPTINKKCTYYRVLIKWKPEAMPTINDGVILYGK